MLVSFSTSAEYSWTSSCKGTRLMALCDVALGKCFNTYHHDMTLTRPPDDFDSVHGVRCSDDVTSDFKVGRNEVKLRLRCGIFLLIIRPSYWLHYAYCLPVFYPPCRLFPVPIILQAKRGNYVVGIFAAWRVRSVQCQSAAHPLSCGIHRPWGFPTSGTSYFWPASYGDWMQHCTITSADRSVLCK